MERTRRARSKPLRGGARSAALHRRARRDRDELPRAGSAARPVVIGAGPAADTAPAGVHVRESGRRPAPGRTGRAPGDPAAASDLPAAHGRRIQERQSDHRRQSFRGAAQRGCRAGRGRGVRRPAAPHRRSRQPGPEGASRHRVRPVLPGGTDRLGAVPGRVHRPVDPARLRPATGTRTRAPGAGATVRALRREPAHGRAEPLPRPARGPPCAARRRSLRSPRRGTAGHRSGRVPDVETPRDRELRLLTGYARSVREHLGAGGDRGSALHGGGSRPARPGDGRRHQSDRVSSRDTAQRLALGRGHQGQRRVP